MKPSSPILSAVVALAAGCGSSVDTTSTCALSVDDSPARGPADAWVTVVEFADYQCSYCRAMEPGMGQLTSD
jgi:protein-disulfide isomerase